MGGPPKHPEYRGLRVALEIETQGAFIFRATAGARWNQGLTGVFLASGFHPSLPSSLGEPLKMCP